MEVVGFLTMLSDGNIMLPVDYIIGEKWIECNFVEGFYYLIDVNSLRIWLYGLRKMAEESKDFQSPCWDLNWYPPTY
jgi:hypothetical protein